MILLNIYIGFSLLTFVMLLMQTYITGQELKREHPGLVREFNKKHKSGLLESVFTWVKILITCFIPIVNIGIFCHGCTLGNGAGNIFFLGTACLLVGILHINGACACAGDLQQTLGTAVI